MTKLQILEIDECKVYGCGSDLKCTDMKNARICHCNATIFDPANNTINGSLSFTGCIGKYHQITTRFVLLFSSLCFIFIISIIVIIPNLDKNECKDPQICDHKCHNTYGSYYCACNLGYELLPDNKTCISVNSNVAATLGGAVGGSLGFILIVILLILFFVRRFVIIFVVFHDRNCCCSCYHLFLPSDTCV